jgi:serine O-acetyltransferase
MFDLIREDFEVYGRRISRQGLWVMVVYRFGRWVRVVKPAPLRVVLSTVYRGMKLLSQVLTGIDLPCEATVGRRFKIENFGVVISPAAVFGDDVIVREGVSVELRRTGERGAPVVGDRVDIGSGAKLLGPIMIGDDVTIGANAVVIRDVPSNSIAVGIPARARPRLKTFEEIAALTFDYGRPAATPHARPS